MNVLLYCEPRSAGFWFDRKKMPPRLPTEKARHRHERRQPYEAVIGEPDDPRYVVALSPNRGSTKPDSVSRCREGHGDFVSVNFIDGERRCYMEYGFQEKQPGMLFLTRVIFREFADETNEVVSAKILAFKEDGSIFMVHRNLVTGSVEEREATFSVEDNWEEYPHFGDYTRLCRGERTKTG
jgi:hypothetical protein